jgi:hypothetical protein
MSGSSGDEVRIRDQPVEKLLHALCAFRSMIQDPAYVGFEPWFPSVLTLIWALDRSDTDFFNRLVPYGRLVKIGKTYHNPQVLECPYL